MFQSPFSCIGLSIAQNSFWGQIWILAKISVLAWTLEVIKKYRLKEVCKTTLLAQRESKVFQAKRVSRKWIFPLKIKNIQ